MIESQSDHTEGEITLCLRAWSQGDRNAFNRMMPLVAEDLKQIARRYMRREAEDHVLEPKALVNELFLKLASKRSVHFMNSAHFYGCAADIMRRILVDHARVQHAKKRGGDDIPLSIEEVTHISCERDVSLVALDDALKSLAAIDRRKSRIVTLRFFAGLNYQEVGAALGISPRTARREWLVARCWLLREMRRS